MIPPDILKRFLLTSRVESECGHMIRRITMSLIVASVLFTLNSAGAENLAWEWPAEGSVFQDECSLRSCDSSDETTWRNKGEPCIEPGPGEKCVVGFEYKVTGKLGFLPYAKGEVPVSHCGTYTEDISDKVRDAFAADGTFNEDARWKYLSKVRSLACDGTVSEWVTHYSGDETFCNDVEAGDTNVDGVIDKEDVIYLLLYLFFDGPPPGCFQAANANGNGFIEIVDAVIIFLSLPPE